MKVLIVANFGPDRDSNRCGIANFAVQTSTALRRAGVEVEEWDGGYSTIYGRVQRREPAYLPADLSSYDVVHFVWHPLAINHYGTGHWPTGPKPLKSIYITDLPPYSGCPCLEAFPYRVSALPHEILRTEASEGLVLPYPIVDWVTDLPKPDPAFTVGWTGIRGDGRDLLELVCRRHGWTFAPSDPTRWLPLEEEIRRLARSSVNVCWYHEQRNLAGAPGTCLASRRPLLLNRSGMFTQYFGYGDEIYLGAASDANEVELEQWLTRFAREWESGDLLLKPRRVYDDLGWTAAAQKLIRFWEEGL